MWQPRIKKAASSKFMGLVAAIEEDIAGGLIGPGERMPPQRGVAAALGIDLTTVTRAYNEARTRGLIVAHPGRGGTHVAGEAGERARRAVESPVDLSLNIPPQPARADLRTRIGRAVAEVLRADMAAALQYLPPIGTDTDRAAGASFLSDAFGSGLTDRLAVTAGAQSALFAAASTLLKPGDRLCAGLVAYPGVRNVAEQTGAQIRGLPIDTEGLDPDGFEAACRRFRPKALYVVPTIDNPTTATLSSERRAAIVASARRHNVAIIEDDPYRRLAGEAPAALASLAPERTWHIATLAKCATPGLRVAYLLAPSADALARVGSVTRASIMMPPPLLAAVATRWISDGTLNRITAALRDEAAARQLLAARHLAGADLRAHPNGYHAWLTLPDDWPADRFAAAASESGVAVVPASMFAFGAAAPNAVRLAFGAAPDRVALTSGLRRIAALIRRPASA